MNKTHEGEDALDREERRTYRNVWTGVILGMIPAIFIVVMVLIAPLFLHH